MRKIMACWLSVLALAGLTTSAHAYTVTVAEAQNCSVSISPEETDYAEGDEITVTLTADDGCTFSNFELFYECTEAEWWEAQASMSRRRALPRRASSLGEHNRLESYYFNDDFDDEYEEEEEGVTYTFTMPARNVEVEAVFLADGTAYAITVTQKEGGTTRVSPLNSATAGTAITIEATPDEGYRIDEVRVYERMSSGGMMFEDLLPTTKVDATRFTFSMPANPVRVEVEYTNGKLVGDVNGDGSVTIADVAALVEILLGNDDATPHQYDHEAANVNGDDGITVADVTALVEIILE